jgi:hypothetical protein
MSFIDFLDVLLSNPIELVISSIVIYIFFSLSQIGVKYLKYIVLDKNNIADASPKYLRIIKFIKKEMIDNLNKISSNDNVLRAYVTESSLNCKIDLVAESVSSIFSPVQLEGNDIVIFEDFLHEGNINSIISRYGAQDLIVSKLILEDVTYYIVVELSNGISMKVRYQIEHNIISIRTLVRVYDEIKRVGTNVQMA